MNKIKNAHSGKVTAIVSYVGNDRIVSGGDNGSIRVWNTSK